MDISLQWKLLVGSSFLVFSFKTSSVGKGLGIEFFHCMTCNYCLGIKLLDHKGREKGLEINCPICCDFLFTSSATVRALPCGHFMHSACFQVYFGMLDALLASEELPEEYRDHFQASLPFMEPKQKKGDKAQILKKCCFRVKCFIDTDAGFCPTPSKTDLAQHHIFTHRFEELRQ